MTMKKYDLALAAFWLVVVCMILGCVVAKRSDRLEGMKEMTALYNHKQIGAIEIKDSDCEIEILPWVDGEERERNWTIKAFLKDTQVSSFEIKEGVLHIDGLNSKHSSIMIKVKEGVEVTLSDAPHVKQLSVEEFQAKLQKDKERYDFQ